MEVVIDSQHYITEIVDNIRNQDKIKADIVMSYVATMGHSVQENLLHELSKVNSSFTVGYIIHLLEIVNSLEITAEEIQITLQDMLIHQPDNLIYLFENPEICDKIDVIDLATAMQFEGAIPYLIELLNKESNHAKITSIIDALGAIGSPQAINTISEYLYSENKTLTYAAINALKEIGTPDALGLLSKRMGSDSEIDKAIIDIFVSLQDEYSMEYLNLVLKNPDPQIRNYAKTKMIQLGQKVVLLLTKNLEENDSEFVIHSLNILGIIGEASSVNAIRQLLFNEPKDSNIRFAAYEALGMLPLQKGIYILSNGLNDPIDQVRNAAARAIEKNNNAVLRAGILNLIKNKDDQSLKIVAAFIDSEADSIFRNLFPDNTFQILAMQYLCTKAHPDIRRHFSDILRQYGYDQQALRVDPAEESYEKSTTIYVVDDSRMLLKVYKSNLHEIGFVSKLFEFPESAIEHILKDKPDVVITDLNMPKITGLELTRQVREIYTKEQLPIILITTQSDQDETVAAYKAGVNDVVYKPFTKEILKERINQLIL